MDAPVFVTLTGVEITAVVRTRSLDQPNDVFEKVEKCIYTKHWICFSGNRKAENKKMTGYKNIKSVFNSESQKKGGGVSKTFCIRNVNS